MALRWLVTETRTGLVVGRATVVSPSLTLDFARSQGSAEIRIAHMIRDDQSLDLPRAREVAKWTEPAGAYSMAIIDAEPNASWAGAFDRIFGEWIIRGAAPVSDGATVPVTLGGILGYAGDRLLERDYIETGMASWIISDLLTAAMADIAITIPKPNVGPVLPVDFRAGKTTYAQAVADVLNASGVELRVSYSMDLTLGTAARVRREVVMGMPVYQLNTGRVIRVGSNGIRVTRPTSIDLWANSVNVYGSGFGDDQYAGNAARGRPAGMPTVTRSFSHPDVDSGTVAAAMAAQHLKELTGVGPLQVEVLRANWTNKFPVLGDGHRVIVPPCLAFPDGIDGIYRVTRVVYQPPDDQQAIRPDSMILTMEPVT